MVCLRNQNAAREVRGVNPVGYIHGFRGYISDIACSCLGGSQHKLLKTGRSVETFWNCCPCDPPEMKSRYKKCVGTFAPLRTQLLAMYQEK